MGGLQTSHFVPLAGLCVCLLLLALLGTSEAAGVSVVTVGGNNITLGRNVGFMRKAPQTAHSIQQKSLYSMWRNTSIDMGVAVYGYDESSTWLRMPPTSLFIDWAGVPGISLDVWNAGGQLVGCWSAGFALMSFDFSYFWKTPVPGVESCGIDQDTGLIWLEQRATPLGDIISAYRLDTVSETTIGEPTGISFTITNCDSSSESSSITIRDGILVLICATAPGYIDLRGPPETWAFKTTPRFGPVGSLPPLPLPNTSLWYFPGPSGIERWSMATGHPTLQAISASGYPTPRTASYVNNPTSSTLYWIENPPLFVPEGPANNTLYQLGTSESAYLNPVPASVGMTIPGIYARYLSLDWTINRILNYYDSPSGLDGVPGADLGLFSFGSCRGSAVNCTDCVSDGDLECGWCVAGGASAGGCVPARDCQTRWFQDVCPLLRGVSSIDELVTGLPFVLQLDATLFFGNNVTCKLHNTANPSQIVNLQVIQAAAPFCGLPSPDHPLLNTLAGEYTVELELDGYIPYPEPQIVRFTNCSAFSTCAICTTASSECDWCVYDGACVNSATACSVSGPASQRPTLPGACPVQLAVTPNATILPLPTGASVNIQATSLITPPPSAGAIYSCRFDLNEGGSGAPSSAPSPSSSPSTTSITSPGSFVSSALGVTCAIPTPVSGFIGTSDVSLTFNGHKFADNSNSFTYYDCTSPVFSSCGLCLASSNALCGWNTASSTCGLASECAAGADCRSTCPQLTNVNQTSFHVSEDLGVSIAITGTFWTATSPSTWTCKFGSVGTTNGIRQSETVLVCPVPSFSDGSYFSPTRTSFPALLEIQHDAKLYIGAIPVNWYACGGQNCSSCLNGGLGPKCRWNFEAFTCGILTANQLPECPKIQTMSDTFAHISGGLSLTVTPAVAPAGSLASLNYRCAWTDFVNDGSPIADQFSSATLTAGHWTCTTPNVMALTSDMNVTATFAVQAESTGFGDWTNFISNPQPFTFVDCAASTSCSSCLLSSQCAWVNYTVCTSSVQAEDEDPIQGQCPSLVSISPVIQAISAKVNVTVTVQNFPAVNWIAKYKCRWITPVGAVIKTNIISATANTLTCPFSRTYHDLNTAMLKFDIIFTDSLPLTSNQLDYEVYDCSQGTSCGLCNQIHPLCGWCSDIASCLDNTTCSIRSPTGDWSRGECPYINSINPPHTALGRASSVTFSGQFGSAESLDMKCRFKYVSTGVVELISVSESSATSITCDLPSGINSATKLMLELGQMLNLRKRVPTFVSYTGDVFNFDFIDCTPPSNQSSCGECSGSGLDSRCGWCAYDAICADAYSCDVQQNAHFRTPDACPQMVSLTPAVGPLKGGTEVTVSGTFFLQGVEGTSCRFGSQVVPATVQTGTTLTCQSPSAASVGITKSGKTVDVDILWHDGLFTRSAGFKFTYKNNDSTTTIVLATVLSLLALIIIVVIVLFVIFYKKITEKRNRRRFLKLREPDYLAVAFAQTKGIEMALTPGELKSLSSFIRALEKDSQYTIVQALAASSPGSQADYLARAAVYFYQSRGRALDMLMTFVSAEVKASEHEGTLFRASSFACKLFNQYARYHGLPYLWRTLGFYVNQLAEFAKEEREEERDDILGPGSMEVDPDRFEDDAIAPSEFDIRLNQYELLTRASKFLKAIFASLPYMRPEFRQLCARVKAEVGAKFTDNNADYKAVGGFIFLRFICPSIMAPHVYGLVSSPPNETAQRYFVLLAKSLQNLANQTLPGTNEDFMARMNEFITKNIEPLHMWVDDLCNGADTAVASDPELTIPDNLLHSSVAVMQHTLVEEWDNVVKHLSEDQIDDLERVKDKGPIGKKQKAKTNKSGGTAPPRRGKA